MKAGMYRIRRDAGECAYTRGCEARAFGAFCKRHRKMVNAWMADNRRREYARRKLAGLCTYGRCRVVAQDNHQCCPVHAAAKRRWKRREPSAERWRASRVARGLCGSCSSDRPLASATMCDVCRGKGRERARRRWLRMGAKPHRKCRICRNPGHNRVTCPDRFLMDLAPYATARNATEMPA